MWQRGEPPAENAPDPVDFTVVEVDRSRHNPWALRTDPRELDGTAFDLLVVGAGIQGAAIAREAALRGLSVVLCDARDIAAGTSSRSSRLVHGGLRYLRNGHFALVREALHERERLLRLSPHLVRPLPMLMPFYRDGGGSPWMLRLGTWLYSKMASGSTLPRPRRLSVAAAAAAFPGLRTEGLRSTIEFFDAATQDARLTLANVLAAVKAGARLATHCEVAAVSPRGVRLIDRLSAAEVVQGKRRIADMVLPKSSSIGDLDADQLRVALGINQDAVLAADPDDDLPLNGAQAPEEVPA